MEVSSVSPINLFLITHTPVLSIPSLINYPLRSYSHLTLK
jgi:hypothetical protein